MKRIVITAMLLLALGATALGPSPAFAAGALVGTGDHEESSGCTNRFFVTIAGAETAPGLWAFDVGIVSPNNPFTCDFPPAVTLPFVGDWNPTAGGCVPVALLDVLIDEQNLCLWNPVIDSTTATYDFTVCDRPVPLCEPRGSVTVTLVTA